MRKKPPGVEAKGQEQQDFSYRSHHHHKYNNKESRGEEYQVFSARIMQIKSNQSRRGEYFRRKKLPISQFIVNFDAKC